MWSLLLLFQTFVVDSRAFRSCITTLRRKKMPKNRYRRVEAQCHLNERWPPVGDVTRADESGTLADIVIDLPS